MTDTLADLTERAAWTAIQSFLAVFTITDLSTARTAAVAAAAAILSVLKSYAATKAHRPALSPVSTVRPHRG